MESAIFEGKLRHRRSTTPARSFTYSLFMAYLDLGELHTVFRGRWLWSARGPNLAWFRRADHYGDPRVPLDETIRALVLERTGVRPPGPIRLLTHLRYFGHCMNPVSFFYCFESDGRTLHTIVAEVSNTPWNERHMYVLPMSRSTGGAAQARFDFAKAFHVSPFLPMDMDYAWRFGEPPTVPGERLWVHMENKKRGQREFEATLVMERRPMRGAELARALALHPAMTVQVVLGIYAQALRLWLAGSPFYSHPRSHPNSPSPSNPHLQPHPAHDTGRHA